MKGKKIIIISIIINILTIGVIYNFIKKDYLNNEKILVKAMTATEYENNITSLNQSHIDYANYIKESKTKIASAITDMGVNTSNEATLETMSSNIRTIARDASSISYDNSSSTLTSTNVQEAVDELESSLGSLIKTEGFSKSNVNVTANGSSTATFDVTLEGYTAIGIVRVNTGTQYVVPVSTNINPTSASVVLKNLTSSDRSCNAIINVLYIKTEFYSQ